jgi:hypothetical protein
MWQSRGARRQCWCAPCCIVRTKDALLRELVEQMAGDFCLWREGKRIDDPRPPR